MKKIFSKELIIGVTVLITLMILFFGIEYLKGINLFHDSNYYFVSYTNVDGLQKSAPVTVNGYKVGLVKDIQYEYENPGHIKVELSLDNNLRVPQGSKAVLSTGLLGTASIVLQLNNNPSYHEAGDYLIGENAKGLLDDITTDILPSVNPIMEHVDTLLVAANTLVTDPAIYSAIQRIDRAMANIEQVTSKLSTAMNSLQPIMGDASSTMKNVNTLSRDLLVISRDLQQLSDQLSKLPVDSTFSTVRAAADNVYAVTENVNTLTQQLNDPTSSLGLLLNDPSLYNNLNNTAAHIDSLLIDVRRQPKRYIPPIKIF